MPDPAIAVLPYGSRLGTKQAGRPLSELNWPLGCPDRLLGKRICDLASRDHVIVYPKTAMHFQLNWHCPALVYVSVLSYCLFPGLGG